MLPRASDRPCPTWWISIAAALFGTRSGDHWMHRISSLLLGLWERTEGRGTQCLPKPGRIRATTSERTFKGGLPRAGHEGEGLKPVDPLKGNGSKKKSCSLCTWFFSCVCKHFRSAADKVQRLGSESSTNVIKMSFSVSNCVATVPRPLAACFD